MKAKLRITRKTDLSKALDGKKTFPTKFSNGSKFRLKNIQDLVVLSKLNDLTKNPRIKELSIAEIGGDQSRIAEIVCKNKSTKLYDIIDIYDLSIGNGTIMKPKFKSDKISIVECLLGTPDSKKLITDSKYDYLCSISVLEHIDINALSVFFEENIRVLKPNGVSLHCIDIKLNEIQKNDYIDKLIMILSNFCDCIDIDEEGWAFKPGMASQPDDVQIKWCNRYSPEKALAALNSQTCNIELYLFK